MVTKAEIQRVRALADKRARQEEGLFVAEGEKLVRELAASGWPVHRIYAVHPLAGLDAEPVTAKEMERMSRLHTPASCLAVAEIPHRSMDAGLPGRELVLALDGVQDPGNLGTIVRLADWFGIGQVVCSPDTVDCFNPKTVQATMGAILRVAVHYTDLPAWLARAVENNVPVYGTFLDGEDMYREPLGRAGILLMGSEGSGITPEAGACVTHRLRIPSYPPQRAGSESLNVAVATGIVCAEFRRRG